MESHFYLIICIIITLFVFSSLSSSFLSVMQNKDEKLSLEFFATPKYDLTVNFTLEIPRVNITTQTVQNAYYDVAKRSDPGLNQIVSINFHLACNKSKNILVVVNELEPIEGWAAEHYVYYDIVGNATKNFLVKEYFSSFTVIYSVRTSWLNGLSEIAVFRDAYHYDEAFKRENQYTTERVPLLVNVLSITLSLIALGIVLALIPDLKTISFRYYPWLTIFIAFASILVFIFWTPIQFSSLFGSLSIFLSYFPHFDSTHLIGNMKLGIITLFLLESWVGGTLDRSRRVKLEIFAFIVGSDFIFWIIGMGGFGASYVNEVLGSLLIISLVVYRKELVRTKIRLLIFPLLCSLAGYALYSYVIDWFVTGYIFQYEVENAYYHLMAFVLGAISASLFLIYKEKRTQIYLYMRGLAMRDEDKKSLALLFAGSLVGLFPSVMGLSVPVEIKAVCVFATLSVIAFSLLYGVGIPQQKFHEFVLKNRWKEPLRIGILYDLGWDIKNGTVVDGTDHKEIITCSDVNPIDWKETLEKSAKDREIGVNIEFINVSKNFDSYTAILNPYGGAYPELDLKNLSTLDKIAGYVKEGGLFINVADILSYWAHSHDLHRTLDITSSIYAALPTPTGIQIVSSKPFELTPLMKTLGLRVFAVKSDNRVPQELSQVLEAKVPASVWSERFAVVESNIESCIPTSRLAYTDGNTYDVSALFFVKYGEGEFLFSLIWIVHPNVNIPYHSQQAKDAIRNAISKLAINKLASKVTKTV
jgi:hypothetical protein